MRASGPLPVDARRGQSPDAAPAGDGRLGGNVGDVVVHETGQNLPRRPAGAECGRVRRRRWHRPAPWTLRRSRWCRTARRS
jgi:hypothetical protein